MKGLRSACAAAALSFVAAGAHADTIKVGVIGTMSGPYALFGQNFKMGIDAWVAEHGNKVGGHTVEFVYRDEVSPNPAQSKALAQELIVKEKVQYIAGLYFTPNAMAVAPLLQEAKVPMVVLNAATSSITEKSPYIVRTSFTMFQNTVPAAKVAKQKGAKKVAIAVSDYGPGIDAETAFKKTFEAEGGSVVEAVRMPLATTDFGPIMQRIKDSGADMIFTFLPAGPPTLGFVKAYIDNGLKAAGVKLMSTGDVVTEPDLPNIGDSGIGILSTYHYAVSHDSPENKAFLALLQKGGAKLGDVTMTSVAAYDGARLIYKMIEATGGKQDPEKAIAAVKDMKWTSPRGPVSIDPTTRHITQSVYLREVEKQDGKLINKEIETFKDQPDWGLVKQ
ncbi:ABC transporter substrate-binding protein [Rhodopseudomonas palustris]|uniref:ABC transporter substrate-binding protein n=1 Tax=Rhodopseudomonas palustris (strain ATCC BAA-98 / CGA009) TaxID=258594 RepID=Q6NB45_RHOPA|nr:ABC transporter substrate-binding protein [Rhodopseudomonas palustris]OPF91725.1 branched-chain amino acid ABC transporter substrate-binding protein [Rhodopseudomonas palustris]PPQ44600.1 ABC transporter substrate-binding protein [Rhodopseudomonas palustris]QQM02478.1 Leucine-, isoleucine-, valine-, threonine-, and alanine-binding protein [Rhodopseudomonas palustris]RJF60114.1 ABC transporter substrate-binding protein [Rhodopseudomonas palustris]WAB78667.1 ABC transporter substrate-binding 